MDLEYRWLNQPYSNPTHDLLTNEQQCSNTCTFNHKYFNFNKNIEIISGKFTTIPETFASFINMPLKHQNLYMSQWCHFLQNIINNMYRNIDKELSNFYNLKISLRLNQCKFLFALNNTHILKLQINTYIQSNKTALIFSIFDRSYQIAAV